MKITAGSDRVIALDFGTSSVRALVFDRAGHKVGEAVQHNYQQRTTADGGVECDADELFALCTDCIDQVHATLDEPAAAVAIACFWHSLIAVDGAGHALTPVLSWADNRSAAWVAPLRATIDEEAVHERTGCIFHTSYWPAKLLWLHHSHNELFSEDIRWMSFGEYFALRLFGTCRVSLSMASGTGLFHQTNCDWDDEMLAALPIERANLSPLCDFDDDCGELASVFAERWPLLQTTRWFPALGDGACSNVGSGGIDATRFVINVGTSGAVRIVLHDSDMAPPPGLWRYRLDRRRSLVGGAVSNAGNVFAWTQQNLKLPADAETHIAAMEPDAHGLTVLPFLAGERSPLWNADARLVLAGAGLETTPLHMLRACLEGASLRFAVLVELLREAMANTPGLPEPLDIVVSGGALDRSPAWARMMCEALGTEITECCEAEASARGAALLALEACKFVADISELPATLGSTLRPDAGHVQIYARARQRQNAFIDLILGDPLHVRRNS